MASATITITITDNGSNTLIQIRDKLITKWNGDPAGTNNQKLVFIQGIIAKWVKSQYLEQIQIEIDTANQNQIVDIV